MHSVAIQLNPLTLWVESSCNTKKKNTKKTELILLYSPEVVTSLLGGQTVCGTEMRRKPFAPAVHMHIFSNRLWTLRHSTLRIRNPRTGVRNYLLCQRTPASRRGKWDDNSPSSFPCWSDAMKGRNELSRAERQQVSPRLRKKEERKRVGDEEEETRGIWEGKSALQHHANPENNAPSGRACLQKSYTDLNLNSVSLAFRSCIKANSNREGIRCIMANIICLTFQLQKLRSSYAFIPSTM